MNQDQFRKQNKEKQNGKLQDQTLKSVVCRTVEAHQKIMKKLERMMKRLEETL